MLPTLSPQVIMTGMSINYSHCKLRFGGYVQTHKEANNNTGTKRTTGAIVLRPTGNQQGGTCVGGYQPDVCCDNIVAALKVHTEVMNRFPLSGLGTRNSTYSDHKLCTNEDNTSGSITPTMLSDAAGLDLDNNTLEKTSVLGDNDVVVDGAIGDDGLTFDGYKEHPDDEAPAYIGVPQRNIVPMNNTLMAKVELLHLIEKHKLHMNVMIPIWDWAVKSQS